MNMLTRRLAMWAVAGLSLAVFTAATWGDVTIDASRAIKVQLPAAGNEAVEFTTSDGKQGWARKLSGEAIPTPAYAKGRIYTGGGMSSAVFMAIDAATGKTIWSQSTQDNGPTSPVVSDGVVSYNTESCATETRDDDYGNLVWSEVTGGSLLTQPVVANGLLVIPHPTMQRKAQMADDAFRMLCVDLKTGKHHWDANMTGDVLAAPVAASGRVFFTCTDGRVFAAGTRNGGGGWHAVANANSAPVVVGDTLAVSTEEKGLFGRTTVSIRRYTIEDGTLLDEKGLAPVTVGAPILANRQRAEWDYQGPKIAAAGKKLFNAPGQTINSIDMESGKVLWQAVVKGDGLGNGANSLTPPALGKEKLYLGTAKGHILAINQADASVAYAYNVHEPLASQPLLVDGNLYFGTASGYLVCLKVGDADAKNWHAWGGDAQHNKVD
jgi:outer membrane protein assembly factor BamB